MTIHLPPELEERLKVEAARHGVEPSEYVAGLIEKAIAPPPTDNRATMELFARWEAEDATDDPDELARRQREGEEFMQNLNRNRLEMEGPNSRMPWK